MNDLEQAIAYHERKVNALKSAMPCDGCPIDECSEEHRQLAEWLVELKAWRRLGELLGELLTEEQIKKLKEKRRNE